MMTAMLVLYWVMGAFVLVEALNKLERSKLTAKHFRESSWLKNVTHILKIVAWSFLAFGSMGAFILPMLLEHPIFLAIQGMCITVGFGCLVVRTRIQEILYSRDRRESRNVHSA